MSTYPLTLLYDESCPLCKLEIDNLKARNSKGLLAFVDASAPDFDSAQYAIPRTDLMAVIHAETADGTMVKGMAVFRLAYDAVGLGWLTRPTAWPILQPLFDRAYIWLADNRHGLSRKFGWLVTSVTAYRADQRAKGCKQGRCDI